MGVPQNCPLCNAGNEAQFPVSRHVWGGEPTQAVFRCESCDIAYVHPRMTEEQYKTFYESEFEDFMARRAGPGGLWHDPEKHVQKNEPERLRRMRTLEKLLPEKSGRILELGSSSGFMLFPMAEMGFDIISVEPSLQFSEFIRSRGITCFNWTEDLLDSDALGDGFDLIMHFGVLEHVNDPEYFIRQQWDMLRPGGKIMMEAPCADDALLTVYDIPELEKFYWVLAHYWNFSAKSLGQLINKMELKYEIRLDQRYDLSNHLAWAQDRKPGGAGSFTGIFGPEIEEQYKQALIGAGHCDTVVAILTKEYIET
jgi:SAM-dependent methyltransferase